MWPWPANPEQQARLPIWPAIPRLLETPPAPCYNGLNLPTAPLRPACVACVAHLSLLPQPCRPAAARSLEPQAGRTIWEGAGGTRACSSHAAPSAALAPRLGGLAGSAGSQERYLPRAGLGRHGTRPMCGQGGRGNCPLGPVELHRSCGCKVDESGLGGHSGSVHRLSTNLRRGRSVPTSPRQSHAPLPLARSGTEHPREPSGGCWSAPGCQEEQPPGIPLPRGARQRLGWGRGEARRGGSWYPGAG